MQNVVKMQGINEHITCRLCAGYLIDATTITECLHTFCKVCIVKHLQSNKDCPICNAVVHETQPILNLRPDRTMQDIVYKLVPGLYQSEQKRREEFYKERGETDPNTRLHLTMDPKDPLEGATEFSQTHFCRDSDLISLEIRPHSSITEKDKVQEISRKFMRCSSRVTVYHLKRFLLQKLCVPALYDLDILCDDNVLHKDSPLKFIWLSYWLKKEPPMILQYKLKQRLG